MNLRDLLDVCEAYAPLQEPDRQAAEQFARTQTVPNLNNEQCQRLRAFAQVIEQRAEFLDAEGEAATLRIQLDAIGRFLTARKE